MNSESASAHDAQLHQQLADALAALIADLADQLHGLPQDGLVMLGAADRLLSGLRDNGIHVVSLAGSPPAKPRNRPHRVTAPGDIGKGSQL